MLIRQSMWKPPFTDRSSPESPDGNLLADLVADALRHLVHERRVDVAGRHRVDGDALARDLPGHRHREAVYAGLGSRVVGLAELASLAVHGRDIDHPPEPALRHAADNPAGDVVDAVEISAQDRRPVLRLQLDQHRISGDAGGVDQHVDRPDGPLGPGDALAAVVVIGCVEWLQIDAVAGPVQPLDPCLSVIAVGRMTVGDDPVTGASQYRTNLTPDGSRPASDQRCPS
jgi:hypothetical protein